MSVGGHKGRVEIKDVKDRTGENDPEYMKVVKEIQDQNARYNRISAFDRQDLLYLSDFKDAETQKELELRHMESVEFSQLRSRLDSSELGATTAPGLTSSASGGPAATAVRLAVKEKAQLKPASKLLPLKKVNSGEAGGGAPVKRLRSDSLELTDKDDTGVTGTGADKLQATGSGGAGGAVQGAQQAGSESGEGLQGLLGGYGSSSEGEEEQRIGAGKGGATQGAAGKSRSGSGLPNAAELLGDFGENDTQKPIAPAPSSSSESSDEE